ncbi:IS630 family transposase [Leptolyngbya cf. ectocarpi LEGE 11479]|uniref:IS630 family transposase n=1 Tax=Leptolyngbya cf. ectocarpi LEGE 11479 TaxID=1828722 RepID=A0A929FDF2_LEPEC|nr:IS630 family transposase [Leptolyngbya ectocarpi]MBE9071019.1 IS630 family transposase [Leptolyngbya cf. ectocarpi LEGE 11479]
MKQRFIQGLSPETIHLLQRIYRSSGHHQVRQRAHCLLLSFAKFNVTELMSIFGVTRKTIYTWFDAWERQRLVGLYDRPGRGRKATFSDEEKEQIRAWAKANPKNLRAVLAQIKATWKVSVSKTTLKRILKSASMSWRRLRRSLAGKPDPGEYATKQEQLEAFKRQETQGKLDLRYMDESGFCLVPYLPYAWQAQGETLELPSQRSKRLNVLAFMNRQNDLVPYVFEKSITSEVVIACIDDFSQTCEKRTVIVMDQASVHRSAAVEAKIDEWKAKNVEIFWLPAYSPQLNLIEILWRFMKYEWIEFDAYESWESLVQYVEKVLKGFGEDYVINFG